MVTPSDIAGQRRCPQCGVVTLSSICASDGTTTLVMTGFERDALSYQAGDVIGDRYRIGGILGRGGFGAVYAAEHIGTKQPVAVKMLTADPTADGSQVVRRFFREARITASLKSRHTVRVFDVGQSDEGTLFQAMERLDGPDLESVLRLLRGAGKTMSQDVAVEIGLQVLDSLAEAHRHGLVHRDLKPANIILADLGETQPLVKVLDFGIARTRDSSLTNEGQALGTPAYMSPEQCQGKEIDGRSDLYSLGILLYRCVTGRLPFEGPNPMAVLYKHATAELPDPRGTGGVDLTDGFVAVLVAALAKAPEDRFASTEAMRDALLATRTVDGRLEAQTVLRTLVADYVGDATRAASGAHDHVEPEETRTVSEPHFTPPPQRSQSRRWPAAAAIGGALALVLGALWLGVDGGSAIADSQPSAAAASDVTDSPHAPPVTAAAPSDASVALPAADVAAPAPPKPRKLTEAEGLAARAVQAKRLTEKISLMRKAVELSPDEPYYRKWLADYEEALRLQKKRPRRSR